MILRYLIAGSGTTLFSLLLLYLFNSVLHIHYLIASALSFILGIIVSFIVHKYWTFEDDKKEHAKQFSKHAVLMFWNFGLNLFLMFIFVDKVGLIPIVGQILTSGLIAIQSFIVYRKHIFT